MKTEAQQLAEKFDMCINGVNEKQDAIQKLRNAFMCGLEDKPIPKDQMIYLSNSEQQRIWDTTLMYDV
jgi:hypothetical protein